MEKAKFNEFVTKLKAVGVEEYEVRCQGGNRTLYNNSIDDKDINSIIIEEDDTILSIEVQRATNMPERTFNITRLGFDNIDSVLSHDMTREEAKNFINALGKWDSRTEAFFKAVPIKKDIIPGTAGLRVLQDDNGIDILPPHSAGMVTYGIQPEKKDNTKKDNKTNP